MITRTAAVAGLALGAALAAPASAKDRAQAAEAVTLAKPASGSSPAAAPPTESLGIAVFNGRDLVWSGSLRVGGPYGSASFSQSKSEYGLACAAASSDRQITSSESLSFGISRSNWQQDPNRFAINLNWSRPVEPCQGEGTDTFGFNRVVVVPRGQTITTAGTGAMSVRVTRPL